MITTEPVRAWCLVRGEWVETEDPVMAICDPNGGDVYAAMTSLGYEAWCSIGADDRPSSPVSLALFSRECPPLQFLLQLEGNAGNVVEHVFAETLPDAMEILARWAPIAGAGVPAEPARRYDPARHAGDPDRYTDVAQAEGTARRPTAASAASDARPRTAMDRVSRSGGSTG